MDRWFHRRYGCRVFSVLQLRDSSVAPGPVQAAMHNGGELRIPNVVGGHLDVSDLKFGTPKKNELESVQLQPGDLLFVRTNGVQENAGRCSIYRGELAATATSRHTSDKPETWFACRSHRFFFGLAAVTDVQSGDHRLAGQSSTLRDEREAPQGASHGTGVPISPPVRRDRTDRL